MGWRSHGDGWWSHGEDLAESVLESGWLMGRGLYLNHLTELCNVFKTVFFLVSFGVEKVFLFKKNKNSFSKR